MNNELKHKADAAKDLYRMEHITREEAKEQIMPFIDSFNGKLKEIAKKWNQKPRTITFAKLFR